MCTSNNPLLHAVFSLHEESCMGWPLDRSHHKTLSHLEQLPFFLSLSAELRTSHTTHFIHTKTHISLLNWSFWTLAVQWNLNVSALSVKGSVFFFPRILREDTILLHCVWYLTNVLITLSWYSRLLGTSSVYYCCMICFQEGNHWCYLLYTKQSAKLVISYWT